MDLVAVVHDVFPAERSVASLFAGYLHRVSIHLHASSTQNRDT